MTSIAPVANFGPLRKTGALSSTRIAHEALLNVILEGSPPAYVETGPELIGMGNAVKIYITYAISRGETDPAFRAWVNLCWMQRAKWNNDKITGAIDLGVRPVEQIIRGFENIEEDYWLATSCNRGIFYDAAATRTAVGDFDDLDVRYQRIRLPFYDPPFDQSALNLSRAQYRGVVHECVAKADELYLVLTTDPDTFVGAASDSLYVDIAIGSNSQGEQQ